MHSSYIESTAPGAKLRATILTLIVLAACYSNPSDPITEIKGTWGGDDAGLITTDSSAHVHIGCTLGDTSLPIRPDATGHFDVAGTYNVDAYPIDRGILHPARFTGSVSGNVLTLSVRLTDNGRQLGPVKLVKDQEPKMGPCPICRKPGEERLRRGHSRGSVSLLPAIAEPGLRIFESRTESAILLPHTPLS